MSQVDSFEIEHEAEILGKLIVVARDGKILPLPDASAGWRRCLAR